MRAWYLLYTKPRRERVALENLERQGYEAYLPLMRARVRRGGRYTGVVEPMFPRYLFVHLSDESDDWGPIRSTVGVAGLVRFGRRPAWVPDALVEFLRAREDAQGIQTLPVRDLEPGQRVRIVEGVFAGYEAIYEARSGNERVILLLETAERVARMTLRSDDIEPLSPDWPRSGQDRL